ncbi:MAG TPA: glycosyl hydrolase [Tepidisphaeraceae bacterium]|nr:glycosyl hydrolase [Tepidisphaeraceae bacterium]
MLFLLATHAHAQTTAPSRRLPKLPIVNLSIDCKSDEGPLELYRHTLGHGGVNSNPLSPRIIEATQKLHPRLIRIFIQEFFNIYPDHGKYDWSRLDPYMESFAATGAKVVAAITIKPKPLYPAIDQRIWRPNNAEEWQQVISALVKRYSIDKQIVTYWEVANEPDIGENGGCPYLITDPADYAEYYKLTIDPILKTFPNAKIGGPAVANASGQYLPKFIDLCLKEKLRLDFISWHLYSDDPDAHARLVTKYKKLLDPFGQKRPETLVTEWSKNFDPISVQELAFDPRRAAIITSSIIAMTDAGLDWSFYYHLADQHVRLDEFKPFFKNPDIMYHHWNEIPHRFGLFGVAGEVRPQYFVYQMLTRMSPTRLKAISDVKDIRLLASRDDNNISILAANYAMPESQDHLAKIHLTNLNPGPMHLTIYRIDKSNSWSSEKPELIPTESREVDVKNTFSFQVLAPADSVTLILLQSNPQ